MEGNFIKFIFFLKDLNVKIESFFYNLYQSILSIIKVIFLSKFGIRLPKSSSSECYLLGNGPSLKEFLIQPDLFQDKEMICVNNFPSTPEYELLKPQNLLFLDGAFYSDSKAGLSESAKSIVSKTIKSLLEKTTWQINLFLPAIAKKSPKFVSEISKNQHIKIHYFNYTVVKGFKPFTHFLFKNNLGMPLCQNVLGAGIFLALNIGYKKVFVLGADHTWLRDLIVGDDSELYMKHNHFYSNKEETIITKIENTQIKGKITMGKFLEACVKTFDVYYVLEDYAKILNSKIYNATSGSYIDAFEKIKISLAKS